MFNSRSIDNFLLSRDISRFKKLTFGENIHFTECKDYLIRYKMCGKGENCIVIIPNAPNMIEHYDHLVHLLEDDFKIFIFELPGFGFSVPKKVGYDYSLQSNADLTIQLLDYFGLSRCIFSLPCVGGFITLKVAEMRPDLVGHIVCIQTLCWSDQQQWVDRINKRVPIKTPLIGQLLFRASKTDIAQRWYDRVVPNESSRQRFMEITVNNFKKGAHYTLASSVQSMFNRKPPTLAPTDISSVVIWGNADKSHHQSHQWSMLKFFSNFEPHEFTNAGHFPELEQPERFARILKQRFLSDITT